MALKALLASLDGIEDGLKALYAKRDDGKFALDVEGLVDKTKLDEFRSSNVTMKEQIEKLTKDLGSFNGIDPVKYKDFIAKLQSEEEKKLMGEGKLEEVVAQRTDRMRTDFLEQLSAKDKAIAKATEVSAKANNERDAYIVEAELRRQVENPELGFQPGISDLVKESVLKEFSYRDGKVIRIKGDGSIVFGKSGEPATINEYLQDIVKDRPYLVKVSTGAGARQQSGNGTNGAKTMRRVEFDAIIDPVKKMELSKAGLQLVD